MKTFEIYLENENLNHKELIDFFKKRKEGAKNIAKNAKEKGNTSTLTYWHFVVKNKSYSEVIEAIKSNKGKKFFEKKCRKFLNELKKNDLKQKKFQEIIGRLEVWKEAYIKVYNEF